MDKNAPEHAVSPALDRRERDEVTHLASPRAIMVHEVVLIEGEAELARPASALVWSGLAAGLSMGFSMVGDGLLRAGLPDEPWRPLVSSFGYSFGFLIVILGRQQLFTENTLKAVLPLLHKRSWVGLGDVLRLWSIVLAANIAGTLLFAWVAGETDVFPAAARHHFVELGRHAAAPPPHLIFAKAVFAGWLIALLVWLLPLSGAARPFVIVAVTYLVSLGGLAHIIAGSVEVACAAVQGAVAWSDYLLRFMLPTLSGNIVGGVVLVALLAHAQVREEGEREGRR